MGENYPQRNGNRGRTNEVGKGPGSFLRPLHIIAGWFFVLEGGQARLSAFVLGLLSALALPPFHFVPFLIPGFCGLAWLLDGIYSQQADKSRVWAARQSAFLGWCFGFGFFLAGLYWIGFAFLVDADSFAWMIPFVAVLMPGGLALFTALALAIAIIFWRPGVARLFSLAALWVGAEWLRGHVLTGFPWNLVGYAWADWAAVSQSVALFGIYGLSLVTVLVCLAPAVVGPGSMSAKAPLRWMGGGVLVIAVLWGGGAWRLVGASDNVVEGVRLRLVQPSIPQVEKWRPGNGPSIFARYQELTFGPGYEDITHVIWPESAVPYILSRDQAKLDDIAVMLGANRRLITGSVRIDFDAKTGQRQFFNALHVIESTPGLVGPEGGAPEVHGRVVATYDKFHLVPFGEYLPFSDWAARIGVKQMVFGEGGYTSGPGLTRLAVPGAPDATPLICYEVIFPGRVVAPEGVSGWIINLTNDAWFGDTNGPRQHLQMARMRAIETGLPVIRAANNGISAVIDPYGRIKQTLLLNESGVLDAKLPQALPPTFYQIWSESLFLAFIFLCGLIAFAVRVVDD